MPPRSRRVPTGQLHDRARRLVEHDAGAAGRRHGRGRGRRLRSRRRRRTSLDVVVVAETQQRVVHGGVEATAGERSRRRTQRAPRRPSRSDTSTGSPSARFRRAISESSRNRLHSASSRSTRARAHSTERRIATDDRDARRRCSWRGTCPSSVRWCREPRSCGAARHGRVGRGRQAWVAERWAAAAVTGGAVAGGGVAGGAVAGGGVATRHVRRSGRRGTSGDGVPRWAASWPVRRPSRPTASAA